MKRACLERRLLHTNANQTGVTPFRRHHGWNVVWLGQGGVSGDGRTDAPTAGADENEGEGPRAAGHAAGIHRKRDKLQN